MINVFINVIDCAFTVCLISLLFAFQEGMRPQKKQVPKPGSINILKHGSDVKTAFESLNLIPTYKLQLPLKNI